MKPHHPKTFLKSTIVVKWTYVTPAHAIQKIHKMRKTCEEAPYLDCVLEHAEITNITKEFARMHKLEAIAELDWFEKYYDEVTTLADASDDEAGG